jgi:uncharacterized glyoxalase superfamily protein PhnB
MANLLRIAPEIPVANLHAAVEHYESVLGFRTVMKRPEGDYAIVERGDVAIHLFEDAARTHSPSSMHIFTTGLDGLHDELRERGAHIKQIVVSQPWGCRDFRVHDDSGNELKFTEPLPED